jgi:glycosyltransferase involved in cell wall biosynthesis
LKIVIVASNTGSLIHFRGEMIREMRSRQHSVTALAPYDDGRTPAALAQMDVGFGVVPMSRTGLNPVEDLRTVAALASRIRRERPDVVLAYTAKPVIYGLVAARLARVPRRVAMITGKGSALSGGVGTKRRLVAFALHSMYRTALRGADLVFFQNPDDMAYFRSRHLVAPDQRCVRINGSGVNLEAFPVTPLPDGPVTFLMVARLVRDKGVLEYVEAARRIRAAGHDAHFRLLGGLDSNPTGITQADIDDIASEGIVEYLGVTDDVPAVIAAATVIVLPSYIGEGVPRSVLEGMSMGRAVITTDEPGCRETVEVGRNGVLVPARDATALAQAMATFIEDPDRVAEMGAESRRIAEDRFDVHKVNHVILASMGLE